ncbi:polysaccharide biosynthesis/export family protein [Phenylobacterium koreense]|uniref:Polysaccharide export outer membrane protein n=2 Tax=Phenylobacterium TaxID=20 RepID=A0ABV2ENG7_9CAUL
MKSPIKSLGLTLALICAACGTAPAPTPAAAATAAPSADADQAYLLGAGDKLKVTVYGEADLTGEFVVGDRGAVSFPLVGEIPAQNRSVADFKSSLTAALQEGYLKDPRITVEVISYRPYYILGEVTKPGEYPYTNGLTVLNAVAAASGFTYRANTKRVFIKRAGSNEEQKFPLTATERVQPGDTIRIGERYF